MDNDTKYIAGSTFYWDKDGKKDIPVFNIAQNPKSRNYYKMSDIKGYKQTIDK